MSKSSSSEPTEPSDVVSIRNEVAAEAAEETFNNVKGSSEAPDVPPDDDPGEELPPDAAALGREAAKYRRKLREAEGQRDALTERLAGMQREAVERIAAEVLAMPAGLWAGGAELEQLLDEDGTVDRGKVLEAANTAAVELGLGKARRALYVPGEGRTPSRPAAGDRMLDVVMGRTE